MRPSRDDLQTPNRSRRVALAAGALAVVVTAGAPPRTSTAAAALERELAAWAIELGEAAMASRPRRDAPYLSAALGEAGPAAYPVLERLLFSADGTARQIALDALAARDDPRQVPLLRRAFLELSDSSARERALARLRALGAADPDSLADELAMRAATGGEEGLFAVAGLALLGPVALPRLAELLDGERPELARAALDGIAGWADESALEVILEAQRAPHPGLHGPARGALVTFATAVWRRSISGRETAGLLGRAYRRSNREGRVALLDRVALVDWRGREHAFVREAARSAHPRSRQLAAAALEQFESARGEAALRRLLADPVAEVRWQAAISLARTGEASVVPQVLEAMAAGYRLRPPPPGPIRCGTGHDPYLPAKSALVLLTGRNLESSEAGDAAVWAAWWRHNAGAFDAIEAQVELLDRVGGGEIPVGANPHPILARRGGVTVAARLIDLQRSSPGSWTLATLAAIGRRHAEVGTLLLSMLADRSRPAGERRLWLQVLGEIDPALVDDYLVATDDEDLLLLTRDRPGLAARPAVVRRLVAMLPGSPDGIAPGPYGCPVYERLRGFADDGLCEQLRGLTVAERSPVCRLQALATVTRVGCAGARELVLTALAGAESRALGAELADLAAGFGEPADLPAILGTLGPGAALHERRSIHGSVARLLGATTGPGFLRQLASPDPRRRRGARSVVRAVLENGWKHPVSTPRGRLHLTVGELARAAILQRLESP